MRHQDTQVTQAIRNVLSAFQDPVLKLSLCDPKILKAIQLFENRVFIQLLISYLTEDKYETMKQSILSSLHSKLPDLVFELEINAGIKVHKVQSGLSPKPGIKNIIAVASGKGPDREHRTVESDAEVSRHGTNALERQVDRAVMQALDAVEPVVERQARLSVGSLRRESMEQRVRTALLPVGAASVPGAARVRHAVHGGRRSCRSRPWRAGTRRAGSPPAVSRAPSARSLAARRNR